jgi:hypothetical protein
VTPAEAWAAFDGLLPDMITPARRCLACGERVPEEPARWMKEEHAQMKQVFLDLVRRVAAAEVRKAATHG